MSAPSAVKTLDTPPSSDVDIAPSRLPPSPPLSPKPKRRSLRSTTDRLFGVLRLLRARHTSHLLEEEDWKVFKLTRGEFAHFEAKVAAEEELWGWYEDKIRYDWEPQEEKYALRMPTRLHEDFISSVVSAIRDGITQLADRLGKNDEGKEVTAELRKVVSGGSPTLKMQPPRLENSSQESEQSSTETNTAGVVPRSPDATFFHPEQELPCLVVEVGYSQQRKELPRLADSYIIDSRHAIRCVIALDITYPTTRGKRNSAGKQEATTSIYRPATETDTDGEEIGVSRCDLDCAFQDAEGKTCDGNLTLHISDFLPPHVLDRISSPLPSDTDLTIPFADLAAFLTSAQNPSTAPSEPSSSRPKRFRKRKRSPSEELSDSREAKFVHEELRARERDRSADDEWSLVSRRRGGRARRGDDVVEGDQRRKSLRLRATGKDEGTGLDT